MASNYRPANRVWLRLLYDAFAPETVETFELGWGAKKTLAEYVGELPSEAEWLIWVNGKEVNLETDGEMLLDREDQIGVAMVPLGGDGLKSILRMLVTVAATIAGAVIGFMIAGPTGAIAGAAIGAGLAGVFNALVLGPKKPKTHDESPSYGIDGAKNSATEGIPYPVVYGSFRTAGNFADCYTQNVGDLQYLYVRAVMNDGLIDSISDIEINEQPIANFTDVQTRIELGSLDADVNDWFASEIVQINKGIKLGTNYTSHITSSAVDKVRFDVTFSSGLVDIDSKKGTYRNKQVTFEIDVREVDPDTNAPIGSWTPAPITSGSIYPGDLDGDGKITVRDTFLTNVFASVAASGVRYNENVNFLTTGNNEPDILYRRVGATTWESAGGFASTSSSYDYADATSSIGGYQGNAINGATDVLPIANQVFTPNFPTPGDYEIMPVNGAVINQVVSYPSADRKSVTVTDNRTRQLRYTFETGRLKHGFYEARIRRTTATSTDQYKVDEVYLTDIGEVQMDPVALRGTANLSMRIKLSEQLNAIPQVTGLVKGSVVQKYDIFGNPTVKEWSANPAWIALDILCGEQRGAGMALSRMDWPRWLDFAEYCDAEGLQFNGIFDTDTNIGDALRSVMSVGNAAPVPFGTKYSVAIDNKRVPTGVITQAQVLKDTFEVTYMSVSDRANEYELTFYDKTDRNKAKTIRYVDPKAVTYNEVPRVSTLTVPGIDNIAQARASMWRMIYSNRLLIRTVGFETSLNAINMSMGEVKLIQHDQMRWASSGLLAAGSTPTKLQLDAPVTMEAGKTYSALVQFDALMRTTVTVSSVVGAKILVTSPPLSSLSVKRAIVRGQDIEITRISDGIPYNIINLASAPVGVVAGDVVQLWDTDAVVEVSVPTVAGETTTLNLASALPDVPAQYAPWVFGPIEQVRKPYQLTGISGQGLEKRKLTFVEYNDLVYSPPEVDIPTPVAAVTDRDVGQVTGVLFDYERLVESGRKTINSRVHWSAAGIRNYAGADVYMGVNGGSLRPIGTATNNTDFQLTLADGDLAVFKVVAFNKRGDRAVFGSAPGVMGRVSVVYADLDAPAAVNVVVTNFQVEGTAKVTVTPPADTTGIDAYEGRYKKLNDTTWLSMGSHASTDFPLGGLETATYQVQIRSISSTSYSPWVEKQFTVAVAPGSLMANYLSGNDRNPAPIPAPVIVGPGDITHTLNTDGSADISMNWAWPGDEATIDGFEVIVTNSTT